MDLQYPLGFWFSTIWKWPGFFLEKFAPPPLCVCTVAVCLHPPGCCGQAGIGHFRPPQGGGVVLPHPPPWHRRHRGPENGHFQGVPAAGVPAHCARHPPPGLYTEAWPHRLPSPRLPLGLGWLNVLMPNAQCNNHIDSEWSPCSKEWYGGSRFIFVYLCSHDLFYQFKNT